MAFRFLSQLKRASKVSAENLDGRHSHTGFGQLGFELLIDPIGKSAINHCLIEGWSIAHAFE